MTRTKTKAAATTAAGTVPQLEDAFLSARDHALVHAMAAKGWAAPRIGNARDWAEPRVKHAGEWAEPRLKQAGEWAEPKLKHARDVGVGVAAPVVGAAAEKLAPAVDSTRSAIDELLPKVAETAAAATAAAGAAKLAAAERGSGAYSVLRGDAVAVTPAAPKRRRLGRLFLLLGLLAAVGAVVISVLRRRDDITDPWAQPYPTYPPTPVPPSSTPPTTAAGTVAPSVTSTPVEPVPLPDSGTDGSEGTQDSEGETGTPEEAYQRPETDIADVAPGQHSVTDDGKKYDGNN